MDIRLNEVGKKYRRDWIFRGVNFHFQTNGKYAVLGPNGSGKSTFLKVLSGHLSPSEGNLDFSDNGSQILIANAYQSVSYAAPYIELIEEMTLLEALQFHQKFKPFIAGLSAEAVADLLAFPNARQKEIRFFSSGMKQRLKLALALCSDTAIVLLDEPTTNLDRQGAEWYQNLAHQFGKNRLLVVASNVEADYHFCEHRLDVLDWKPARPTPAKSS